MHEAEAVDGPEYVGRVRRRRRYGRGAACGGGQDGRCWKRAAIRGAQRRRPRGTGREPPARRLRRPGLPPIRLRERGDALGLRPPLRQRRAAAARPQPPRGGGRRRSTRALYPRAGTLGGCTAHNAMILVCPHDADWDAIASLTGDPSWSAERMYLLRAPRELPPPAGPALASAGGWGSTAPATAGTAGCTPRKRSRRTPWATSSSWT